MLHYNTYVIKHIRRTYFPNTVHEAAEAEYWCYQHTPKHILDSRNKNITHLVYRTTASGITAHTNTHRHRDTHIYKSPHTHFHTQKHSDTPSQTHQQPEIHCLRKHQCPHIKLSPLLCISRKLRNADTTPSFWRNFLIRFPPRCEELTVKACHTVVYLRLMEDVSLHVYAQNLLRFHVNTSSSSPTLQQIC